MKLLYLILFALLAISSEGYSQTFAHLRDASKKYCVVLLDSKLAFGDCSKDSPLLLKVTPDTSGKLVQIKDTAGKCVDFYFTNDSKAQASFNPCNESGNQRFEAKKEADGAYRFVYSNDTKLCLDMSFNKVRLGSRIILFPCDATSGSQKFYEVPTV